MKLRSRIDRIADLYTRGVAASRAGVDVTRIDTDAERGDMGSPSTDEVPVVSGYPCSIRPWQGDSRTELEGDTMVQRWRMVGPAMYDSDSRVLFKTNDIVRDGDRVYIMTNIENIGGGQFVIELHLGEVGDAQSH